MNGIVDRLLALFAATGIKRYGGERVSQCEHALQCAFLAEREGASGTLVAAALLHDIGHLLYDAGVRPALRGIDDRHEELGAKHLVDAFGPAVAEPVRLHVAAKRYLCATEPGYAAALSPASVYTLSVQGGPMRGPELADFAENPYAARAVRVRRWDDLAKDPEAQVPGLDHFTGLLRALAR